jgi:putative hydrolase of the HAD superfamily
MIKAIFFDCFGVLVGTGFWNVYRDAGGDPERDWSFIEERLRAVNAGQASLQQFRQAMADRLGISVQEYMAIYDRNELPNAELITYIRNELKPHYRIGIISNAGPGVVESKIVPDDLKLFDDVVVSSEVGLLKPDPGIYLLACERLGVKLHEALFTDDQARYLGPAAELGMETILFGDLVSFRDQLESLLSP